MTAIRNEEKGEEQAGQEQQRAKRSILDGPPQSSHELPVESRITSPEETPPVRAVPHSWTANPRARYWAIIATLSLGQALTLIDTRIWTDSNAGISPSASISGTLLFASTVGIGVWNALVHGARTLHIGFLLGLPSTGIMISPKAALLASIIGSLVVLLHGIRKQNGINATPRTDS